MCFFHGLFVLGTWPKGVFTNGDILRLHLACEVMQIDARQSIYYAAFNALGTNGVHTTMYNVYLRVLTLYKKMMSKKKINLDAAFLPKRKRVRKHVLNKPAKKPKKVDALLDSQLSINSCFFDSQGCAPTSPPSPSPPVSGHARTHKRITLFVVCCSFMHAMFAVRLCMRHHLSHARTHKRITLFVV